MTNEEKIIDELVKRHEEKHEETPVTNDIGKVGAVFVLTVEGSLNALNSNETESNDTDTVYLNEHFKHIIMIYITSYDNANNVGRYDWNVFGYADDPSENNDGIITEMLVYGGTVIDMDTTCNDIDEYHEYVQYLSQEISKTVLNKIGYREDVKINMISVLRFLLDLTGKLSDSDVISCIEVLTDNTYTEPLLKRYLENDYDVHLDLLREDKNLSETDRANIPRLNNIINQVRERDE